MPLGGAPVRGIPDRGIPDRGIPYAPTYQGRVVAPRAGLGPGGQEAVFARNRERVVFDMVIEPTILPEVMNFVK